MGFNSSLHAWNDMEVFLNGQRITKITGFECSPEQETEEAYGAGDEPLDIQTGNRKYNGTATFYKNVIDAMNRSARAAGARDLMDIPWTIVCNFKPTMTDPKQTNTYTNVRFSGYKTGMEQNAKTHPVPLPFKCLRPAET